MKSKTIILSLSIIILIVLCSCSPATEYDIRGAWDFTMIYQDGLFYDDGTITFSGSETSGTYRLVNYYEIEYEGEFKVNGVAITLVGDDNWKGNFIDANHLAGTWEAEDESGEWSATRRP